MLNAQRSTLNSELDVGRLALEVGCLLKAVATPLKIRAFQRSLLRWYRGHGRDLPWRRTRDPYAIVVSEFMLQQTQVASVIPYYDTWIRRFPDFVTLAKASESEVLHAWQGLGYYARARNLHATAQKVLTCYDGCFPKSIDQMQQLPGLGKYTAHAVASFAFGQPAAIVEANTARVLARILNFRRPIDRSTGRKALWEHAAALLPKRASRLYNSALIDLGALICLPRQPRCAICPVKKFCRATNPESLPMRKKRPPVIRLTQNHAFVVKDNKILLQRSDRRWHGMWILPRLQRRSANRRPIYRSIFPFTNHRVTLNVYAQQRRKIDLPRNPVAVNNKQTKRWMEIHSLESMPIPSPHRRAVRRLLNEACHKR